MKTPGDQTGRPLWGLSRTTPMLTGRLGIMFIPMSACSSNPPIELLPVVTATAREPTEVGGAPVRQLRQRSKCKALMAQAAVAILLLSACSSNPPIISGDTSCERFRHISATPAQIKVYQDNWEVMESHADQLVSHNISYDSHCLGVAP